MLIHLFFLYYFTIPTIVYSQCYSTLSPTWICDGHIKSNDFTYQTILNNQQFENFILTNYQIEIFKIDNYPLTLRLLNASQNQFQTIIITSKNRYKSNLRQLILESNNIEQFNIDTIILPDSLEKISLANNRLKILDARLFSHLKYLTEIDLRNNQLKRILPQLLLNRNIKLDYNPLDCQCTSEAYRIVCEKATSIKQRNVSRKVFIRYTNIALRFQYSSFSNK
jgi:Leucine-rich repeat (LRR) protein